MAKSDSILTVTGLTKRFRYAGGEIRAVEHVEFTVGEGEFVAVVGPSGSGKSTLLHLIAGLCDADRGSIKIDGHDILAMRERQRTLFRRRRIGLVFQAFNLIPDLTGRENILLPSLLGSVKLGADEPEAVIKELGIAECAERLPDAMSGGEQQRVAVARALVTRPGLLLADEPSGNLDTANSRSLCEMVRRLGGEHGTTVLMVTHNPAVAYYADRILVMRDGAIIEDVARDRFSDAAALGRHYTRLFEAARPVEAVLA